MAKTTKKTATKKAAPQTTVAKGTPEQLVKAPAATKAEKAPKRAKADNGILAIHINATAAYASGAPPPRGSRAWATC
jgi:hypothetical protein